VSAGKVAALIALKTGWPIYEALALTVGQANTLAMAAAEVPF